MITRQLKDKLISYVSHRNSLSNESKYLLLMIDILEKGILSDDRTGVGTYSLFGSQLEFDLLDSFPILTSKRIHFKSVAHELLLFLSGNTNVKYLQENGVSIWNEWADSAGDLGPVYGHQWRHFGEPYWVGCDQISQLVEDIKNNPDSRRLIVSAWNPVDLDSMALPPCHCLFQVYVRNRIISLKMYQRSADYFLGVPFNICSYALLLQMLAKTLDLLPGRLIITFGDVHIYKNHLDSCMTQLNRSLYEPPELIFNRVPENVFEFEYNDFSLKDYVCGSTIKAPIAV